jgi:hypothetical protein
MLRSNFVVIGLLLFAASCVWAQEGTNSSTASCNLDDGRQVYIRYTPVAFKNDRLPNGKPWTPGGAAMTLFTEVPLTLEGASIPMGAYTIYPIPGKDKWSVAVNKNVTAGAAYDEKQNVARATMETDPVSQASSALEVAFAHVGDKCTLRIYFGHSASFQPFIAH